MSVDDVCIDSKNREEVTKSDQILKSCLIIKTNSFDDVKPYKDDQKRIIYYKDSTIIHHSILKEFEEEMDKDLIF